MSAEDRAISMNNLRISRRATAWTAVAVMGVVLAAHGIADSEWLALSLLGAPVLVYLCIHHPAVFPLGLYLFLVPFDEVLSVTGNTTGTTATKLLALLSIFVLVLKGVHERRMRPPDAAALPLAAFVLLGCVSAFWAIDPALSISRIGTAAGYLLFYLVLSSYRFTGRDFDICMSCVLLGGAAAALYAVFLYSQGASFDRATISMGERTTNPNLFSFSLLLPAAICLDRVRSGRGAAARAGLVLLMFVLIAGVMVSGSRGSALGLCVIFMASLISSRRKALLAATAVGITVLLALASPDLFLGRWGQAVETGGSGRTSIWSVGLKALGDFWLTGAGMDNFVTAYEQSAQFTPFSLVLRKGAHNIYLQVFVELGIAGLMLLLLCLRGHYLAVTKRTDRLMGGDMLRTAFWGMLTACFFGNYLWVKSFWELWMMIAIAAGAGSGRRAGRGGA